LNTSKPQSHRTRNVIVGAAVILIIGVLVRAYWHRVDAADNVSAPATVAAKTLEVKAEELPIYLTGIGTVQAALSVTVHVRVDGQLEKVAFTEGQDVKSGELLAQIDARPYQAALDMAIAQQAKDEANLQNALVDLARYTKLGESDSIAQQTLDTQRATVAQDRATVLVDKAQIDSARVQLDYTTVRSPIAGRVGLRLIDPGNIVHATDTTGLVVVNQIDPIAVLFTLPEEQFQAVNEAIHNAGNKPLAVEAFERESNSPLGKGELLLINNQIDPTTGTVQLKASFANPAHRLWPGQYVNVHVITAIRNVVTVPTAVVQRGSEGLYAYIVNADGVAVLQPIEVTLEQQGKSVIGRGLKPGMRVVVEGQFKLRPGVKVIEAQAVTPNDKQAPKAPSSGVAPKGS